MMLAGKAFLLGGQLPSCVTRMRVWTLLRAPERKDFVCQNRWL